MTIFVDANVLFTAAFSQQGKAATLMENPPSPIITSDYAAEEARRNLLAKKPDAIPALERILSRIQIVSSPRGGNCPISVREKDQPIFLSALKAGATHLLTGDLKDFGPHMNKPDRTSGIIIQTVGEFLSSL